MRTSVVLITLLALGGCATGGFGDSRYQRDLARLEKDCADRSGILAPTGVTSGRPATEFACRITGPATRIRS